MTIRPRAVRSLRDARERLRDIAAARQAETQLACERAQHELAAQTSHRDEFLAEAPTMLEAARSVQDLMNVAEATGEFEIAIVDAEKVCARESDANLRASVQLGERTRALRTVEKLADRMERERLTSEARLEQQQSDELAGRRR